MSTNFLMTIRQPLIYPDPRLRLKAKPVEAFDTSLKQTIADMFDTMYHAEAIGLAATQVNIQQQIFVMDLSPDQTAPLHFVNAEIIHKEGEQISNEGCVSLPGIYNKVKRAEKIITRYYDENGQVFERESVGLESVCIQHEIDHLKGIVFLDHLSRLKKTLAEKKLEKLLREPS